MRTTAIIVAIFLACFITSNLAQTTSGRDGRDGRDGQPGVPGAPGAPGKDGCDGQKGQKGDTGSPGTKGDAGGPPGVAGTDGYNGTKGEKGDMGIPGTKGDAGGPPGAPGNDGRRGEKGQKGEIGAPGVKGDAGGPPGPTGPDGAKGEKGMSGQAGPPGEIGASGDPGSAGATGMKGATGEVGPKGPPGPEGPPGQPGASGAKGERGTGSGGSVYIRWGKKTCPSIPGTELVYEGIAAGSWYEHTGGGSNYLCLPKDPIYAGFEAGVQNLSPLYGAEFETGQSAIGPSVHDYNVPCAVCCTSRSKHLMLPAKNVCPTTWTLEYKGFLMTEYRGHTKKTYECMDAKPDTITGSRAGTDGALFYHVEATCNGLPCPPYDPQKELTCAVCTK